MARASSGTSPAKACDYAMAGLLTCGVSGIESRLHARLPGISSGMCAGSLPLTVAGQLPNYTAFPFSSPEGETMVIVKERMMKLQEFPKKCNPPPAGLDGITHGCRGTKGDGARFEVHKTGNGVNARNGAPACTSLSIRVAPKKTLSATPSPVHRARPE